MHCARHPHVETVITCASCGTPICPKCMVVTPVGMKCPNCGRNGNAQLFQIPPGRLVLTGITALTSGIGAGFIASIGFILILIVAASYGYFVGNIIFRASGMKRGSNLEILAGAGIVIGGLLFRFISLGGVTLIPLLFSPWFLISLGITTACAISKIRYL